MEYQQMLDLVPEDLQDVSTFQTSGCKPLGKLSIGFGLAQQIGDEALQFGTGKVLMVTDKTIVDLRLHEVVVRSLETSGFEVSLFSDVEQEPHLDTARNVQRRVRADNFSLIVGLGGGSAMDMAKVAFLTGTNPGDIKEYMTGTPVRHEGLPCILLPTTSGTGSEVSPFIVLSEEDTKLFVSLPYLYTTVALVDPLLSVTMPPQVTAATGLDALSHAMDGLIGKPGPLTEALSFKAVELVFQYLERACTDGMDLRARYGMSFASVLGMMAYTQGGGLYAHSCSYVLTIKNKTPHGTGCGVTLPYTLLFNFEFVKGLLARISRIIEPGFQGTEDELAFQTIMNFRKLLGRVGMPTTIKELGISKDFLPEFAEALVEKYYRAKNPRPMSLEEARRFVEAMWHGQCEKID